MRPDNDAVGLHEIGDGVALARELRVGGDGEALGGEVSAGEPCYFAAGRSHRGAEGASMHLPTLIPWRRLLVQRLVPCRAPDTQPARPVKQGAKARSARAFTELAGLFRRPYRRGFLN